jgi:hypothetical protein
MCPPHTSLASRKYCDDGRRFFYHSLYPSSSFIVKAILYFFSPVFFYSADSAPPPHSNILIDFRVDCHPQGVRVGYLDAPEWPSTVEQEVKEKA